MGIRQLERWHKDHRWNSWTHGVPVPPPSVLFYCGYFWKCKPVVSHPWKCKRRPCILGTHCGSLCRDSLCKSPSPFWCGWRWSFCPRRWSRWASPLQHKKDTAAIECITPASHIQRSTLPGWWSVWHCSRLPFWASHFCSFWKKGRSLWMGLLLLQIWPGAAYGSCSSPRTDLNEAPEHCCEYNEGSGYHTLSFWPRQIKFNMPEWERLYCANASKLGIVPILIHIWVIQFCEFVIFLLNFDDGGIGLQPQCLVVVVHRLKVSMCPPGSPG